MIATRAERQEAFVDKLSVKLRNSPTPRDFYEVRVFFSALGKIAEEKNLAFGMNIDRFHQPFLDYVNYLGLAASLGHTEGPKDKPRSLLIDYYRDAELPREYPNGGMVYPRLMYNKYRARIDNHFNKEKIMEAAREVFSHFQII